jgi:hypothetical protein
LSSEEEEKNCEISGEVGGLLADFTPPCQRSVANKKPGEYKSLQGSGGRSKSLHKRKLRAGDGDGSGHVEEDVYNSTVHSADRVVVIEKGNKTTRRSSIRAGKPRQKFGEVKKPLKF